VLQNRWLVDYDCMNVYMCVGSHITKHVKAYLRLLTSGRPESSIILLVIRI
jgi:hypothetical protein